MREMRIRIPGVRKRQGETVTIETNYPIHTRGDSYRQVLERLGFYAVYKSFCVHEIKDGSGEIIAYVQPWNKWSSLVGYICDCINNDQECPEEEV